MAIRSPLAAADAETLRGLAQAADRERIGDIGRAAAEMTLRLGLVREGTGEDGGQGFANPQRSSRSVGQARRPLPGETRRPCTLRTP
jgi:hypothetical protein